MLKALMLACGLICAAVSCGYALSGATPCAIYWPAYSVNQGSNANEQASLSQPAFQGQAPWYCNVTPPERLICEQSQADMDLEIQIAAAAGIKCFAFVWYGDRSATAGPSGAADLRRAYELYQSSARTDTKWALLLGTPGYMGANPFSDTTSWHANVDAIVTLMQQSRYQTVLTNRPLLYILYSSSALTTYFAGSTANLGTAISYLRTQATGAGLGSPYVVLLSIGSGSSAHTIMTATGADAQSNYAVTLRPASGNASYATLDTAVQASWTSLASGGDKIVPALQIAGDGRARVTTLPPWEVGTPLFQRFGTNTYYTQGTPAALAAGQFTAVGAYMDIPANAAIVDSKAILIDAWTEHAENGVGLQPQRNDPPQGQPPYTGGASSGLTTILNAVGPVLWGYR